MPPTPPMGAPEAPMPEETQDVTPEDSSVDDNNSELQDLISKIPQDKEEAATNYLKSLIGDDKGSETQTEEMPPMQESKKDLEALVTEIVNEILNDESDGAENLGSETDQVSNEIPCDNPFVNN